MTEVRGIRLRISECRLRIEKAGIRHSAFGIRYRADNPSRKVEAAFDELASTCSGETTSEKS